MIVVVSASMSAISVSAFIVRVAVPETFPPKVILLFSDGVPCCAEKVVA